MYVFEDNKKSKVVCKFGNKLAYCKDRKGADLLLQDELLTQAENYSPEEFMMLYAPFHYMPDFCTAGINCFKYQNVFGTDIAGLCELAEYRASLKESKRYPYIYATLCVSADRNTLRTLGFSYLLEKFLKYSEDANMSVFVIVDKADAFNYLSELFDTHYITCSNVDDCFIGNMHLPEVAFDDKEPTLLIHNEGTTDIVYLSTDNTDRLNALRSKKCKPVLHAVQLNRMFKCLGVKNGFFETSEFEDLEGETPSEVADNYIFREHEANKAWLEE